MSCIGTLALTLYAIYHKEPRGIYDYSTGLFDCILFLIGTMYIIAGSYPVEADSNQHSNLAYSDNEMNDNVSEASMGEIEVIYSDSQKYSYINNE